MEKLLRYLNPKTVNFDAMPSGGVPSLTAADVCIMMSYAQISPLQDNLIRLKCFGANSTKNIEKFASVLLAKYQDQFNQKDLSCFYRDWETDRKSTRLNSSHSAKSRMPSSA